MLFRFDVQEAQAILDKKRRMLGRGLSYAEKILFLHEGEGSYAKRLTPGQDPVELYPDRVGLQDATAQMAMLQFMQSQAERTRVPATIHCDHLLRASRGAEIDLATGCEANREVYDFLSSAAERYGLGFWGPGSGIIHQVVFENYAFPGGLMLGTDSHTPNAGGLGMLAIGVGGADAAEAMLGLPWETPCPIIVGVHLTGRLSSWASAKDVVLEMLRRFTVKGGTGKIFEYFGDGARSLSATEKATITNMGAELGATSSVFVYDESMDAYLRNVGRSGDVDEVRAMSGVLAQDDACTADPQSVFADVVELDLASIKPAHAGPFSPDNVTAVAEFARKAEEEGWPKTVSAVLLGSCTNSSYSDLHAAADILEQAARRGLKPKVPFLLSPGSRQIFETIRRNHLLDIFLEAGATILASACGPCIGQWDRTDVPKGTPNVIFTTFNRNFRGRNDANPETRAFLTSPAMAAALAIAGTVGFDPERDPLVSASGEPFKLIPPEPPALPPDGLVSSKEGFRPPTEDGSGTEVIIPPDSDRLERLKPFDPWDGEDFIDLPILVKTEGKTTTDHISPGGKWLAYRGHLSNISKNLLEGALNAFTRETGHGTNVLTGARGVPFPDLALFYKENAGGCVIIGDWNYGEGSSREHAAMTPRFLGAKAVIARSFARIHEANLKKQGILPFVFSDPSDYDRIGEFDRISILGLDRLAPGKPVTARVSAKNGDSFEIRLAHSLDKKQIEWFKAGSALRGSAT